MNPDFVFKLKKSLYGLKQAPEFCKSFKNDNLVIHIYVDDIIFGFSNATLCKEFDKSMQEEFEMSLMRELKFFLGGFRSIKVQKGRTSIRASTPRNC